MNHIQQYTIRFAHCDPAGIVFFPQYFVLFNNHVEDWFAQELGTDFADLHLKRRMGVPTVRIECDFTNPSHLGDEVDFSLWVSRLGSKSVTLGREARVGDQLRVRMKQVLVCIDLDSGQALNWPEDLREQMRRFEKPQA